MKQIKFIDKYLDAFLPGEKEEPRILHKAMRYSVFPGGKRIRPLITIDSARACGGAPAPAAAAACAVEFIHAYSLIHDDLPSMDDDDYRRGKPSCHKKFGEAVAILAGDALLTLAFGTLARNYSPAQSALMIEALSSAAGSRGMAGGQALDITKCRDLEKVNRLKTACLFAAAAQLGAIAARAGAKKELAMKKYGMNIGMAFQAMDDIADGEGATSQKSAADAIKKAKAALKIFGKKADGLKNIADLIQSKPG